MAATDRITKFAKRQTTEWAPMADVIGAASVSSDECAGLDPRSAPHVGAGRGLRDEAPDDSVPIELTSYTAADDNASHRGGPIGRASDYASVRNKLRAVGVGTSGADWIIGCLDPVGEVRGKVPRSVAAHSVLPRTQVQHTMEGPSANTDHWDCIFVQLTGDNTMCFCVAGPAGTDFATYMPTGIWLPTLTAVRHAAVSNVDPVFSATIDVAGAAPNTRTVAKPARPYSYATRVSSSLSVYYAGAAISATGTVFCATVPYRPCGTPVITWSGNPTAIADQVFQCYDSVNVPFRESTLTMAGKPPYTGPATAGVYVAQPCGSDLVARANAHNNVCSYNATVTDPKVYGHIRTSTPGLSQTQLDQSVARATEVVATTGANTFVTPWISGLLTGDTITGGADITVTIFRGLSPDASLLVKNVLVVEGVPTAVSGERSFITPPVDYDPRAIALMAELRNHMAVAYPSSYNFFGLVGPAIAKAAAALWGFAKPIAAPMLREAVVRAAAAVAAPEPVARAERRAAKALKRVEKATRPVRPREKTMVKTIIVDPRVRTKAGR